MTARPNRLRPPSRRTLLAAAALLAAGFLAPRAEAQAWPNRTIRIVVPYTPGGITDVVTRIVGERLSAALGQPVVIENKPGANSILGADSVAKSPPDGYTFVMVIGAHAANATLYAGKLPFDPVGSFAPVSLVGVAPLVMAGSPKLPARSVAELVAYAKANPGRVNFGSSGVGAAAHLTTEYLKRRAGIDMVHVPYRGSAPALTGLMAGDIGVLVDTYSTLKPQIEAGAIRALAIASASRSPHAPDIPTFAEGGIPDFTSSTWTLLLAPAGTPPDIVSRVSAEIARAVRDPAVAGRFADLGVEPAGGTPAEAEAFLKAEVEKWGGIIREAGVKLDP
jgi:tripartite-type tricarboxylate transporter receptor subunit TctC